MESPVQKLIKRPNKWHSFIKHAYQYAHTHTPTFTQRHSRDLIIATNENREAFLYYYRAFIFPLKFKKNLIKGFEKKNKKNRDVVHGEPGNFYPNDRGEKILFCLDPVIYPSSSPVTFSYFKTYPALLLKLLHSFFSYSHWQRHLLTPAYLAETSGWDSSSCPDTVLDHLFEV